MSGRGLAIAALVLLLVLQFLVGLGGYGLIDPDEPRYAEGARSLSYSDADPFVPVFNGTPRLVKPILAYWLMAGSYAVVGVNEWGARLPSALAGIALVLLVLDLGRRLVDDKAGWLAAVVAATSLLFVGIARLATTDALLCLFITLGVHGHVVGRTGREGRALPALLVWVAFGLAMATKGPVGVFVASLVILAEAGVRHGYGWVLSGGAILATGLLIAGEAHWRMRQGAQVVVVLVIIGLGARLLRREPETLVPPIGAAIVLALAGFLLPAPAGGEMFTKWGIFLLAAAVGFGALLVLAYRREPASARRTRLSVGLALFVVIGLFWYAAVLLRDRSTSELFLRETLARFTGKEDAHAERAWFLVPIVLVGFLPWSIAAIPAFVRGLRCETGLARSLPLVWPVAVLLFFSLSPNKLPSYVAPATAGIALLVGLWLRRGLAGDVPGFRWWILGLAGGIQALLLVAGLVLPEESVPGGRPIALVAGAIMTVGTLGALMGLRRPVIGVAGLVLGFVLATGWAGVRGLPRLAELRSAKALVPHLDGEPDAALVSHRKVETGLVFYGRRPVTSEKFVSLCAERLARGDRVLLWIRKTKRAELEQRYRELTGRELAVLHEGPEKILVAADH